MMAVLYVVQFLLVCLALAASARQFSRCVGVRSAPWAMFSIALTPHILALLTLALAAAWPGAPRIAFLLVPAALSTIILVIVRSGLDDLHSAAVSLARNTKPFPLLLSIAAACVSLLLIVSIFNAIKAPIIGHDALIYLNEAKAFAENRDLKGIPGFEEGIGEVVKAHPHQFLWQAFISQALMATDGSLGYPNDVVARGAILITLPLMVIAVTALACSVTSGWPALLAIPLVLLTQQIRYIPAAGSIDAFRIIPFIGVMCLALGVVGRKERLTPAFFVSLVVLSTLTSVSHTINVVFLALLFASLVPLAPFTRITWPNIVLVEIAAVISALPSLAYFAENWFRYGSPFGLGFDYYFYRNSPLWAVFSEQDAWTIHRNPIQALVAFATLQGQILTYVAISAAAIILAFCRKHAPELALIAGVFLLLVFIPLISFGEEVTLQGALLSNPRYGLLVFSLAPALLTGTIGILLHKFAEAFPEATPIQKAGSFGIAVVISLYAAKVVLYWALNTPESAMAYLNESELKVASISDQLPAGTNWLTDRYSVAYYSDRIPIKITSKLGEPFIRAKSTEEIDRLLEDMKIEMVALYTPEWWDGTPLYQNLTHRDGVEIIQTKYWRIFIIRKKQKG